MQLCSYATISYFKFTDPESHFGNSEYVLSWIQPKTEVLNLWKLFFCQLVREACPFPEVKHRENVVRRSFFLQASQALKLDNTKNFFWTCLTTTAHICTLFIIDVLLYHQSAFIKYIFIKSQSNSILNLFSYFYYRQLKSISLRHTKYDCVCK